MPRLPLQPALISSYMTGEVLSPQEKVARRALLPYCAENYGANCAAELYLFMEPDARRWRRRLRREKCQRDDGKNSTLSALEFLSELSQDEVVKIAQVLYHRFMSVNSLPIGIASFLAQINSRLDANRGDQVVAAFSTLLWFADELSKLAGRPVVVELVAGSLVEKVQASDDNRWEASLYAEATARRRVLEMLKVAMDRSRLSLDRLPQIALELEPGPLFLLNDTRQLESFAGDIATADPRVAAKVGFNLDIAHWWLEGIGPEYLREHPVVAERIIHAHIAGHSKRGHFGDVSLSAMQARDAGDFKQWLRYLRDETGDRFSGYVSVEYEAARSAEVVISSVQTLMRWLHE